MYFRLLTLTNLNEMKKVFLVLGIVLFQVAQAQEHFAGIGLSKRVGLLNASVNPAELTNLSSNFEVGLFTMSLNISNNKIGFKDLVNSDDIESLLYSGDEPVNMRIDVLANGPAFGMRLKKWSFGVATSAVIKANIIDVDVALGKALSDSGINSILGFENIKSSYNQKINAATWGEIGFTVARELFDNEKFKWSVGTNMRVLFPSSFANLAIDKLDGALINTAGDFKLNNTTANLNIAYAGPLANGFEGSNNYGNFFGSGINGFAVDFGINFKIKNSKDKDSYNFNSGLSIKNIGSMTFRGDNSQTTNYNLNISSTEFLDLNDFQDVKSLEEAEQLLTDSGFLTKTSTSKDFTIKLPSVINAYVDLRLSKRFYISAFTQQKLVDDSDNKFTTTQNNITITPRFSGKNYEFFVPLSSNEISGFAGGFGLRVRGFFIGSGSLMTAIINDSKQADFYMGFRIGI